jgi:hypothetical protein
LRSGGLPIRDGVRLAIDGGFVTKANDNLSLNTVGTTALHMGNEDEPTASARRFLVSRLLLADPPNWVAYWQGDPSSLDHVMPRSERKTLSDSGLLPQRTADDDLDCWAFWRALRRVPLMSETSAHRKAIGDAGELLSLAHERERLIAEGHFDLADRVQWLARESDAYGFDILSFVGGSEPDADVRIAIEVKTTSLPRAARLHFYLSAHEWETAHALGPRYLVHVWTDVDPGPPPHAREEGPLLVDPVDLVDHLPAQPACRERCRWLTAELHVPLIS